VKVRRSIALLVSAVSLVALSDSASQSESRRPRKRADRVLVIKSKKTLYLLKGDKVIKSYRVSLGENPGPKTCQGDKRTPEGKYVLDYEILHTRFYRSIHIDYPGLDDWERARRAKCNAGGDICLHGLGNALDWMGPLHWMTWKGTLGCIAVTNKAIDEIAEWLVLPTPIEIRQDP
jgi:murein L,D-transpeptidase YafK